MCSRGRAKAQEGAELYKCTVDFCSVRAFATSTHMPLATPSPKKRRTFYTEEVYFSSAPFRKVEQGSEGTANCEQIK